MLQHLTWLTILLFSFGVFAEQEKELPPLDPKYHAIHSMVLLEVNSSIYAYYLTQYEMPHNVQLLYKLEVKDIALLQVVRDAQLITIKTEPFNVERLMRGEKMAITADLYVGHFARGGIIARKGETLKFDKLLYARTLEDIQPSSQWQNYDVVDLSKSYKIYVHRIQQAPSYSQLMHIDIEASCLSRFRTSSAVPKENELIYKFINCGTMKPMYYETEDFKAAQKRKF